MNRLLIISNRLPINVITRKGDLHFKPSIGGLATGLRAFYKTYGSLWLGWPGIASEKIKNKREVEKRLLEQFNCIPIFLSKNDIEKYYNGFSNKTIWPLFHYFSQYAIYNDNFWKVYQHVNKMFSDTLHSIIKKDDIIWIHDYQLMLLPQLIRKTFPDATIGFFLHIPFPSFEVFRLLPQRENILEGLLGADLIGFHTYDYARHFLSSIRRILGYEHILSRIQVDNRLAKVDIFPMGIDYQRFESASSLSKVQKEVNSIRQKLGGRKIILSIDRLDYTKGVLQRLSAFDLFLKENPSFKEKVSMILVPVPSRGGVEQYMLLKKQIDELVGKINGRYGTIGWTPILYITHSLDFHTLVALYCVADTALITPLRDGMNLMAKEYIATKTDGKGVLILSEMAGASSELGEAIIINPNDKEKIADALKEALTMSEEENISRTRELQTRLKRYNVERWAKDFMENLLDVRNTQQELYTKRLTPTIKQTLLSDYRKSNERLIFLDYDGTLIPFAQTPTKAKPDRELLTILKSLSQQPNTEVIIISGRNREIINEWFADIDMGLVAEHGTWIKEKDSKWKVIEPSLSDEWKETIRPILELYVDRTPGSLIEEKTYSLVWHYRRADPELGSLRAKELSDTLSHLIRDTDIGILEGSKVIEVKNTGINKGRVALNWISKKKWSFILAMGDDVTDEDLFTVLPNSAYSIKVGIGTSHAQYNLDSPDDVRHLLKKMIKVTSMKT